MKLTPIQARDKIREELNKGNGIYINCRFFDVRVIDGVLQVSQGSQIWHTVEAGSEFRSYWNSALFTYEPNFDYKRLVVESTTGMLHKSLPEGSTVEVVRETAQYLIISPLGEELKVSKATLKVVTAGSAKGIQFQKVIPPLKPFICGKWHAWQGTAKVMLSDEQSKNLQEFTTVKDCINWLFTNEQKEAARALNAHIKEG